MTETELKKHHLKNVIVHTSSGDFSGVCYVTTSIQAEEEYGDPEPFAEVEVGSCIMLSDILGITEI